VIQLAPDSKLAQEAKRKFVSASILASERSSRTP